MGREISLNPKDWAHSWGLAFANTGRGLVEMFSNKRLWIGIAVSVVLHGIILLLALDIFKSRAVSDETNTLLDVAYDESLPPKAAKMIQQEQNPFASAASDQEAAPIDLRKMDVQTQAKIDMDFSLDKSQADFTGSLRINPNVSVSTEDILAQAPIDINRTVGGYGSQSAFQRVAGMGGSPIELDNRATSIGAEASKPKFNAGDGTSGQEAAAAAGAQKSGFTLSGELSRGDIVRWAMPPYPGWAKQRGLSNITVSIQFSADGDGNVLPTMIVTKSTGYPEWDASVKSTLASWKFKPAEGAVRRRNATITFIFILT